MSSGEETFRTEVAAWMRDHLRDEFEPLRGKAGFGYSGYDPVLAKRWEQRLAQGGWIGIGWPAGFGARALPLAQQVIFHEEYVRAGGPGRIGHIGETLLAPTLIALGTPQQKQRFLPGILAGTEYWAQGYSEPNAGSDLANVQTRARLEADHWVIDGQKWLNRIHFPGKDPGTGTGHFFIHDPGQTEDNISCLHFSSFP